MNTIEDCVCFVTGGAGGIGYDIVKKLIEAEAKVHTSFFKYKNQPFMKVLFIHENLLENKA